jgi:hypothetical protein
MIEVRYYYGNERLFDCAYVAHFKNCTKRTVVRHSTQYRTLKYIYFAGKFLYRYKDFIHWFPEKVGRPNGKR